MGRNGGDNVRSNSLFIRYYRKQAKLTQFALSEKLGVHETTVRRWETGECEPRVSDIKKLCEALNVSEPEFLSGPCEEEVEVTVKFYEDDSWEVNDMATNTQGAFAVSFGSNSIEVATRGNWKTEVDVYKAFEISREKTLEILRLQKGWVQCERDEQTSRN